MRTKLEVLENSVILYIDDIRLTASNPQIKTFYQCVYRDNSDFLDFSYDLLMEKKNKLWWREISKVHVCKFGIMNKLEEQINIMLKTSAKENGIRVDYRKDPQESFKALYPFPIKGEFAEDAWIFTKYYKNKWVDSENIESEYYDLDLMLDGDHMRKAAVGTHFMYLWREDVEKIRDFAKEFMKIADRIWLEENIKILTDETESGDNYPKIIRDYLKTKHNITNWGPIYHALTVEEELLYKYVKYATGGISAKELGFIHLDGKKQRVADLLKTKPLHEIYMSYVYEHNKWYVKEITEYLSVLPVYKPKKK